MLMRSIKGMCFAVVAAAALLASCGGGGGSSSGGGGDTTAPSVPSSLTATAVSVSQIDLSWTASTDAVGVTGYNIYRGGTLLKSVTTTSASDTGLVASTQYCYNVSAYDAAGNESGQSTQQCATTGSASDTTAPSIPSGLTATAASTTQINLSWSASTDNVGVSGYKIYKNGTYLKSVVITTASDMGLSAATNYCYTVSGYDASGNESAQSTQACATTGSASDTIAPSIPAGLTATAASSSQINLSWSASTDNVGVSGYKIYKDGTYLKSVATTTTLDTGLTASINYCYTVSAYDAAGNESGTSSQQCATTNAPDTQAPGVPSGLTATAVSTSQINLSWTASTDNVGVQGYKIYQGGTYLKSSATTTALVTGLTGSTTYCYKVSAYDAAGNESAQSTEVCAKTWTIKTIGNSFASYGYSSIAVDSAKNVHIVYTDYVSLQYVTNTTGTWTTSQIDGGTAFVGAFCSIALDSSGNGHVAYYDSTNRNLKYASNALGSWATYTIDSTGDVGRYTSIAVDAGGKAHISYYDFTNTDLKYATGSGGVWTTETAYSTGDVGSYTSIALDPSGKPYIAYYDYTDGYVLYIANTTGTWISQGNVSTAASYPSMTIDSSNNKYFSYIWANASGILYLKYDIKSAGGSWASPPSLDLLGTSGGYTSIAVDTAGKVHISYYNDYTGDLKYATNASGAWVKSVIDGTGNVGNFSSLALDSDGMFHITYFDITNNVIKYATNR